MAPRQRVQLRQNRPGDSEFVRPTAIADIALPAVLLNEKQIRLSHVHAETTGAELRINGKPFWKGSFVDQQGLNDEIGSIRILAKRVLRRNHARSNDEIGAVEFVIYRKCPGPD